MRDDLTEARGEATQEVAAAIIKAAGTMMARHGNDPTGAVIVAAGFAMALNAIGKEIDPNIPRIVRKMLAEF
jgi:hypothetical protein